MTHQEIIHLCCHGCDKEKVLKRTELDRDPLEWALKLKGNHERLFSDHTVSVGRIDE